MTKKSKLQNVLSSDDNLLIQIVDNLNCSNYCLPSINYYENNKGFFDACFKDDPYRAVCLTRLEKYNHKDAYVKFDNLGQLKSADRLEMIKDLKKHLADIIDCLISYYGNISLSKKIRDLIEENEEIEEDEDFSMYY